MASLGEIWERLAAVQILQFQSESRTGIGWQGSGSGIVKAFEPAPGVLLFEESGSWRQSGGTVALRFTNVFRWTISGELLRLEHLRFGPDKPVFLFEMAPSDDGMWHEISPHLCKQDCYAATLRLEEERLFLTWIVRGPTRDESISYVYF